MPKEISFARKSRRELAGLHREARFFFLASEMVSPCINNVYISCIAILQSDIVQQNIEFERCIDFLVRMIDKYGEEVLRELEEEKQNKEEKEAAVF